MHPTDSTRLSKIKNVIRAACGNLLEMYDFMVFGYYATSIGHTFFPNNSPSASLMLTLMTFGAGFLMRPIGAVVLGAYIDRVGRRKGLILTLALMGIGTLVIAVLPGYATIGLIAPLIILLSRLLQGFSAGAELGGVSVYLAEIAPPGQKGFYASWQSASQQVAVIISALTGAVLSLVLAPETIDRWGWRVPFFIGCMVIPLILLMRRSLAESGEFLARTKRPTTSEILRTLAKNWGMVLVGLMMVATTTVSFYLITAYTPTFAANVLHLSTVGSLAVTFCIGVSNFIWLPVMGSLSDRVGSRPILIIFSALAFLTAYPAMLWLTRAPSIGRLLAVELWLSFIYGSYNGAMGIALFQMMPVDVRTAGFSVAYSLATALFGGFTPAICTSLIHVTKNPAMPGIWMSGAALLGLAAAIIANRTRVNAWTNRELLGLARI